MTLRRHDLLDIEPHAWEDAAAGLDLPREARQVVADWCRRGRPLIVRRRLSGDAPDRVPAALQLPNAYGRLRVATSVPETGVTRRARVCLATAAATAPSAWREVIAALLELGTSFGTATVYGGLMWQYLTGEPTLRATSDLDLLWGPMPADRVALVDALGRFDGGPVRIDGEIEIGAGAVAWRELRAAIAGDAHKICVKTVEGVALCDAAAILRDEVTTC